MKKQVCFKRLLALLLTLVMVFGMAPATPAAAAAKGGVIKKIAIQNGAKNVKGKTITLEKGKSTKLKVTVTPKSAKKKVTYKTSNKKVATVSTKGKITAKKEGTAKITVTVLGKNGKKKTGKVTIKVVKKGSGAAGDPTGVGVTAVALSADTTSIGIGTIKKVTASVTPANAADKTLTWSTDKANVLSVDQNGNVTGLSEGEATVTATAKNGVSGSIRFTVSAVRVTGIAIPERQEVEVNKTVKLTPEITPLNATNKAVVWKSSDDAVASVDNGVVRGKKEGDAVITATTVDGGFAAECAVKVIGGAPEDADGVFIGVTNSLKQYTDVGQRKYLVLSDQVAEVKVRFVKNGVPQGGHYVKLELERSSDIYDITSVKQDRTDEEGWATFTVGCKDGFKPQDGQDLYQSVKLTATTVGAETVEGTATLSFAQLKFSDLQVMNNRSGEFSDIAPFENSAAGETGIAYTKSANGTRTIEYVSSQQVSRAGTGDHEVIFDCSPKLIIPATTSSTSGEKWHKDINRGSGEYSVYNDETNETTTTIITEIPAGITSAGIYFNKLELSEYTKLKIEVCNAANGAVVASYILDNTNNKLNFYYQIPNIGNEAAYIVISLHSEGQVNDDQNGGYHIADIVADWKNEESQPYFVEELTDSVKWSKVGKAEVEKKVSEYRLLPYESAEGNVKTAPQYIPVEAHLNKDYYYDYTVPGIPYVGNAVINVYTNSKKEKRLASYIFPTENERNNDPNMQGDYTNRNELAAAKASPTAILISNATRDNYVGKVTQRGNWAVVDSEESGYIYLKAEIDLSACGKIVPDSEKEMYTSVQWGPVPGTGAEGPIEPSELSKDFYALTGQTVEITAHLCDKNGNVVASEEKSVSFHHNGGEIGNASETVAGSTAIVKSITNHGKTDGNGQVKLTLQVPTGADEVLGLCATSDDYVVMLEIGNKDEQVKQADIHWVQPGLSFIPKVETSAKAVNPTISFSNAKTVPMTDEEEDKITHTVGENWILGYRTIGRLYGGQDDRDDPDYDIKISGLTVNIARAGGPGDIVPEGQPDGVAKISSDKTGSTRVVGSYDNKNVSDVKFTIREKDSDRLIGIYDNIGMGVPVFSAEITVNVEWKPDTPVVEFIYPQGDRLSMDEATDIYIYAHDNYGNPCKDITVSYEFVPDGSSGLDTIKDEEVMTDENGLIRIPIPAPGVPATYSLAFNTSDESKTGQLTYRSTAGQAKLEMKSAEIVKGSDFDKVEITFTNVLKGAQVNAKAFTIKDQEGRFYPVSSAALKRDADGNETIVELTMAGKDLPTNVEIEVIVKPYTLAEKYETIDGETLYPHIEYRLMDMHGNLIGAADESDKILAVLKGQYRLSATHESEDSESVSDNTAAGYGTKEAEETEEIQETQTVTTEMTTTD